MHVEALDPALISQARTTIARLELISHGGTANFGPQTGSGEALYPPGGIVRRDDKEPDQPHKSHLHYRRRLARCNTNHDLERLIEEAEETLRRWKHTPNAPKDSRAWKEQVAHDTRKPSVIAKDFGITRQYVWQIKRLYGTQERQAA